MNGHRSIYNNYIILCTCVIQYTYRMECCLLESNPIGASVWVLYCRGDRFSETPLVPDLLVGADPPHVELNLSPLTHIHRSLGEWENGNREIGVSTFTKYAYHNYYDRYSK